MAVEVAKPRVPGSLQIEPARGRSKAIKRSGIARFASAAALLLCFGVACAAQAKSPSLKSCLKQAVDGGASLPVVVYSDAHGLWGGTTIALGADGVYRRDRVDPREPPQRTEVSVDAARHRAVAALLIELKAWKQQVRERRAVPDESRAGLTIRCGAAEARIWEWYNDLGKLQRIARVRDALLALETQPLSGELR